MKYENDVEHMAHWYAPQIAAVKFFEAVENNQPSDINLAMIAVLMLKMIDAESVNVNMENNGVLPDLEPFITEYKLREHYQGAKEDLDGLRNAHVYLEKKINELHPAYTIRVNQTIGEYDARAELDKMTMQFKSAVDQYVSPQKTGLSM